MRLNERQSAEIEELREAQPAATRRAVAPALEEILFQALPVLDHGFVRVVDYMGDDAAIVQAARVSYGKGTRKVSDDRGLIRYLMRHRHTSPFEMCEIKLHVKLPIFIARQWIRHRTAAVNEYSARYSVLDDELYLPEPEGVAAQAVNNRQGRGGVLDPDAAEAVRQAIRDSGEAAFRCYHELLNADAEGQPLDPQRSGVARELARVVLPLSTYTQWYWKTDLHNLLHFVALRLDPHAQAEIRAYAQVIAEIVRRWVPITFEAFTDYRLNAMELSGPALAILRRMLGGEKVTVEDSGLSPREWRELMNALAV
ncbi:FAD-dependent thymidylate synthase [Geminicoccus flavidas]|uniref:FAD-dependent thymidylate synthase n=1 Tax=Geminicoccus flavidas TaxID=2506407 RepID=UPI001359EB17|nr:FAD-dependent thymidylate synthase [Geminicoccus flavidas]